jgi:cysteine desulfuration protein SufE
MVANSDLSVEQRQRDLVAVFSALPSWEERYKTLIDFGRKLPAFPEELRDEKFKVRGCQSQVWLHAKMNENGRAQFEGDSDAMIVKGLVAVLLHVYSDADPAAILKASPQFLKDLGFESHLSPSRSNGLYAMLKQIMLYAQVFQAMKQVGK